jgi:hypothetical protein
LDEVIDALQTPEMAPYFQEEFGYINDLTEGKCKELFNKIDTDTDNLVSKKELEKAFGDVKDHTNKTRNSTLAPEEYELFGFVDWPSLFNASKEEINFKAFHDLVVRAHQHKAYEEWFKSHFEDLELPAEGITWNDFKDHLLPQLIPQMTEARARRSIRNEVHRKEGKTLLSGAKAAAAAPASAEVAAAASDSAHTRTIGESSNTDSPNNKKSKKKNRNK